jgi:hypothetical protein
MKRFLIIQLILFLGMGQVSAQRKKGDPLRPEVERALMRNRKRAEALLQKSAEALGGGEVQSIQYSGTGYHFALK